VALGHIAEELDRIRSINETLRQTVELYESVIAGFVVSESGYVLIRSKYEFTDNDTSPDLRQDDWYTGAVKTNGLCWSDPYPSVFSGAPIISCAHPFYDTSGGTPVLKGVAGVDVSLDAGVNQLIATGGIIKDFSAFIINDKGQVIMSLRDDDNIHVTEEGKLAGVDYTNSDDPAIRQLGAKMTGGGSGISALDMEGESVLVAYYPLQAVDWTFVVTTPANTLIEPANRIGATITAIVQDEIAANDSTIFAVACIIAVMILAGAFLTVSISSRLAGSITAPILQLSSGAGVIGSGNLDHVLNVHSGDEIEDLAASFNSMIGNIKKITREKALIAGELSVAANIQRDMLPRIFPKFAGSPFFSLFASMNPAKEVGGDFYDFFFIDEERTKAAFVIADVSGKGVPAALFMVISKTLIKQLMLQTLDPAEALNRVNGILATDNPQSMFVTVFIAAIDFITGEMTYANGGHNPPLFAQAQGEWRFMQLRKGVPLGMLEDSRYIRCSQSLAQGDKLYFYTDGINEAMNPAEEEWGNARFLDAANRFSGLEPQEFDEAIRAELAKFTAGAEQSDDITTLALFYKGRSAP
jgi:sigma-B regulation protein RsbU (phosphoserine phosphatase)